jgi:hypothetical protein
MTATLFSFLRGRHAVSTVESRTDIVRCAAVGGDRRITIIGTNGSISCTSMRSWYWNQSCYLMKVLGGLVLSSCLVEWTRISPSGYATQVYKVLQAAL